MPKLYSSRHIIRVLTKHGFMEVAQTGGHKKFRRDHLTVIVPAAKREIPQGTFMSILRQSQLSRQDFTVWVSLTLEALPDALVAEVADFAEFLRQKHQRQTMAEPSQGVRWEVPPWSATTSCALFDGLFQDHPERGSEILQVLAELEGTGAYPAQR